MWFPCPVVSPVPVAITAQKFLEFICNPDPGMQTGKAIRDAMVVRPLGRPRGPAMTPLAHGGRYTKQAHGSLFGEQSVVGCLPAKSFHDPVERAQIGDSQLPGWRSRWDRSALTSGG